VVEEQTTTDGVPGAPFPPRPMTGDAGVDEAVARLEDLTETSLDDHPMVYEAVHRALVDRLGDLEG
jgi:hypothetical protein